MSVSRARSRPTTVDVGALPPTQYLVLEVLAARFRLDEPTWPFPTRLTHDLDALNDLGLVGWEPAMVPNFVRAWLTTKGRWTMLSDRYTTPDLASGEVGASLVPATTYAATRRLPARDGSWTT